MGIFDGSTLLGVAAIISSIASIIKAAAAWRKGQ